MRIKRRENFKVICFACKKETVVDREHKSDLIFFDGRYYHPTCYKELTVVKKTCYKCKQDITFDHQTDCNTIYYDAHYYHNNCFVKECDEKNNGYTPSGKQRNPSKKWTFALAHIDVYKEDAYQKLLNIHTAKNSSKFASVDELKCGANEKIQEYFDGSDLNCYIKEQYDLTTTPWKRIKSVIDGNYKDLNGIGIPAARLLDMWERKQSFLDKTYSIKIRKGQEMSKSQRVIYDLAILVNKYDSYLAWIEKQSILESKNNLTTAIGVDLSSLGKNMVKKSNNDDDIDDILNDIFE